MKHTIITIITILILISCGEPNQLNTPEIRQDDEIVYNIQGDEMTVFDDTKLILADTMPDTLTKFNEHMDWHNQSGINDSDFKTNMLGLNIHTNMVIKNPRGIVLNKSMLSEQEGVHGDFTVPFDTKTYKSKKDDVLIDVIVGRRVSDNTEAIYVSFKNMKGGVDFTDPYSLGYGGATTGSPSKIYIGTWIAQNDATQTDIRIWTVRIYNDKFVVSTYFYSTTTGSVDFVHENTKTVNMSNFEFRYNGEHSSEHTATLHSNGSAGGTVHDIVFDHISGANLVITITDSADGTGADRSNKLHGAIASFPYGEDVRSTFYFNNNAPYKLTVNSMSDYVNSGLESEIGVSFKSGDIIMSSHAFHTNNGSGAWEEDAIVVIWNTSDKTLKFININIVNDGMGMLTATLTGHNEIHTHRYGDSMGWRDTTSFNDSGDMFSMPFRTDLGSKKRVVLFVPIDTTGNKHKLINHGYVYGDSCTDCISDGGDGMVVTTDGFKLDLISLEQDKHNRDILVPFIGGYLVHEPHVGTEYFVDLSVTKICVSGDIDQTDVVLSRFDDNTEKSVQVNDISTCEDL